MKSMNNYYGIMRKIVVLQNHKKERKNGKDGIHVTFHSNAEFHPQAFLIHRYTTRVQCWPSVPSLVQVNVHTHTHTSNKN